MPITSTANRSVEISSIQFNVNDTIDVTVITKIDGAVTGTTSYLIPAADVTPVLDSTPTAPVTIRQTLIGAIYAYLITNGLVVGVAG